MTSIPNLWRSGLGPTVSCSTPSSWWLGRRMRPTTTPGATTPSARRSSTWSSTGRLSTASRLCAPLRQGCVLRCIKVVCYAASMFCAPLQHQGCVLHYIKVMCSAASRVCAPLHQGCVHLGCVLRWETFNDNGKFSLWPFYMKGKNYLHLLSTLEVTTAFKIK